MWPDNLLTGRVLGPVEGAEMSFRFRVVLSGACAVLVALLCTMYAQHVRGEAERIRQESIERYGGEVTRLVVATDVLEAGDVVGYSNVSERDWLVDLAPEGAISSLDDVLGLRVSVPVAAGAPITELNVRDDSSLPEVPEGMVAVSLPLTDRLGLSRGITSGARLVAYEVTSDGARLISNEAQVVAAPSETSGLMSSSVVTVAVPPGDMSALLAASASGDLRLAVPAADVRMEMPAGEESPQDGLSLEVTDVMPEDVAEEAYEQADEPVEEPVKEVEQVVAEEVDA